MVTLPKIKKFHVSNDSLKELGEVIANEKGRRIIMSLVEKEMYVNEIANELDIPISLVIYHLQKLEKLDLLEITEKPITRKTKNHRFFGINTDIFMEFTKKDDNKLKQIFKDGIKLTSISIIGIVSWAFFKTFTLMDDEVIYYEFSEEKSFFESLDFNQFLPILMSHVVVILLIYFLIKKRKG